ncbi:MAG: CAP domain-containing protein [Candidatus Paceibacterota bacterium]|jgi:hypothetical protein
MFSWLKKHFIPHEGNEHRPHFLRSSNTRSIVIIVLLIEIITFVLPTLSHINTTGGMATVLPTVLTDLTNTERESQKLSTLRVNPILNKAAEMKATDMATKGYFAHTSPEGKTPWYWLGEVGYQYQYAGENLAINFSDSIDVTNAWMNSPTHKANIVKGNYTEIGTGIATGLYKGRETVFVAQVYANPLLKTEALPIKKEITNVEKAANAVVVKELTNVLGAETNTDIAGAVDITTTPVRNPTLLQKLFASPRNTTNVFLYIIFGIMLTALLLYIFIKMRNHHKDIITNALVTLSIIGAIFIVNYYFSHKDMVISQSLDYSNIN